MSINSGADLVLRNKIYRVWSSMKTRCFNKKSPRYIDYGARGITVCDRWKNSFENFLNDMGKRPEKMTLDRIDNNGNYEPTNCRWASYKQQAQHTRNIDKAIKFSYKGKDRTINELSIISGIRRETISKRLLKLGWNIDRALSTQPNYFNKPDGYKIKRDIFGRFLPKN